jgi:hypothetical protein
VRAALRLYRVGTTAYVRPLVSDVTLLHGCADTLRAAGATEWHVDAPPGDAAAFEALGLAVLHRSAVLRLAWSELSRLPAELATVALADDDDDLERAFDLPSGRIEMARGAHRVVMQLRGHDLSVLGFAVFDGEAAPLFYVSRPALAATLLVSLRRYSTADTITLVIADDDALADTLVAAGAVVDRRVHHYSGQLPTTAAARCA